MLLFLLLQCPHVGVEAGAGEQLLVGALLDDAPGIHHQDVVGIRDRGQPVRDGQRRVVCGDLPQGLQDQLLGVRVQARGGLVEYQDARPLEYRPGNGDALFLAAGEFQAALADDRVIAPGQRHDEVVDAGEPGGLLDLLTAGAGAGIGDVVIQ